MPRGLRAEPASPGLETTPENGPGMRKSFWHSGLDGFLNVA